MDMLNHKKSYIKLRRNTYHQLFKPKRLSYTDWLAETDQCVNLYIYKFGKEYTHTRILKVLRIL